MFILILLLLICGTAKSESTGTVITSGTYTSNEDVIISTYTYFEPDESIEIIKNIKDKSYEVQIATINIFLNNKDKDLNTKKKLYKYKQNLKVLDKHKKQGRNYIGHITYIDYE